MSGLHRFVFGVGKAVHFGTGGGRVQPTGQDLIGKKNKRKGHEHVLEQEGDGD